MWRLLLGASGSAVVAIGWLASGGPLIEPAASAEELFPGGGEAPVAAIVAADLGPSIYDSFPSSEFTRVSRTYTRVRASVEDAESNETTFQGRCYTAGTSVCGVSGTERAGRGLPADALECSAGRAIDGRLVDQNGTPVVGALVTLGEDGALPVTTDAAGRFRIDDCTPGAMPPPVVAHADCFAEPISDGVASGRPGQTSTVTIRVVRGRRHQLTIRDEAGAPRAGATVEWTWRSPDGDGREWTERAVADRNGVAELLLVPGDRLEATIEHGALRRSVHGLAGLLPDRLAVELRSARTESWIPLRCLDAETGAVLRPARVLVRRVAQPWMVGEPVAVRDAICHPHDGPDYALLDLDDLPTGVWEVWAWSPGYAPAMAVAQANEAGVYPPPELRLRPGAGTLRVQVLVDGSVVRAHRVNVSVRLAGEPDPFRHAARFDQGVAIDMLGRGAVALPPGEYELSAWLPDHAPVTRRVPVGAEDQTVECQLRG